MKPTLRAIGAFLVAIVSIFVLGWELGAALKEDAAESQIYQRLKTWQILEASGHLMALGKLRAQINQGKFGEAKMIISEQIDQDLGILKRYENQMDENEKYYVRGAKDTLETGEYPNEHHPATKKDF